MYLTKADIPEHPVADKIVTSGPIYVEVLKKAGFPENVINLGPSLRFVSLYNNSLQINDNADKSNKIILLPLSFEKNLSFELIHKAGNALEKYSGYEICIRPHPLIPKDELELFLNRLRLRNYIVSSDGTVHEWLRRTHALISTGGTVCILEAAAMGIPVIRLMPDNYFFLDPFASSDYLLKPVSRSDQILEQLELIESIMKTDKEAFKKIGDKVLKDYFGMPCQEAMMSFL
jgi:Leucine-rich repeat (LRR) protein